MDRMTGSAHQSGSSLPWRQQWVLPGGPGLNGIGFGQRVPNAWSLFDLFGSYWEFKCLLPGTIVPTGISLYADNMPTICCNSSDAIQQVGITENMTCRLQGRYAVRDPCRLGIRPSVDQVESGPDQRGKRENKQREASCASETYPSHSSCPLFHFWLRPSVSLLKFCMMYIPWFIRYFNNNQLPIPFKSPFVGSDMCMNEPCEGLGNSGETGFFAPTSGKNTFFFLFMQAH